MLRRLLVGLLIGLVLGGLLGFGIVKVFGVTFGAVLAYVAAAVTGVLVGLVAGKPIWSSGGQIEAGLKAVFGALLAAGGMFAIRQWVTMTVDVPPLPGVAEMRGHIGELPLLVLPLLGAILGGFYEADNTPEPKEKDKAKAAPAAKKALPANVKGANGKARVAEPSELDDEEIDAPGKGARR